MKSLMVSSERIHDLSDKTGTSMEDECHDLVLRVYDTIIDPSLWPSVLDRFVDLVGAQGSIVFDWDDREPDSRLVAPFFSGFYDAEILATYLEKCAHLEARDQEIVHANTGANDRIDVIDDTLLAATTDDLKRQEHVQKLARFGIFRRAAGILSKDNRRLSLFTVQLDAARQPLDDRERAIMATVLPHFAKALDLGLPMRQLAEKHRGVLAAIDRLGIGLCLLDGRGYIVADNAEFERQRDDYPVFRVGNRGELLFTSGKGRVQFDRLMSHARNHGRFGARPRKEAIDTGQDSMLCIEISPLYASEEIGSATFDGFLVSSTDTSLPLRCDTSPIRDAFDLTDAELSVVESISEGLTNPEIAERRGRAVSTINNQVKSILAKSDCANRTQLVRLMLRYGASFLRDAPDRS